MKPIATLRTACVLALSFTLAGAFAAPSAEVDKVMRQGGLQPVSVKGIELAYARPGATLAPYKQVMIDPVEVAFSRSWDPYRSGGRFKLNSEEKEKIRTGVAKLVHEEFVKELTAKGSYKLATSAGPDVLRARLNIANLYVNAPDVSGADRTRTMARSAGQMTLMAELTDSASGQVLVRVADHREADRSTMRLGGNEQEGRAVAAAWARIMREAMDKAQAIGK